MTDEMKTAICESVESAIRDRAQQAFDHVISDGAHDAAIDGVERNEDVSAARVAADHFMEMTAAEMTGEDFRTTSTAEMKAEEASSNVYSSSYRVGMEAPSDDVHDAAHAAFEAEVERLTAAVNLSSIYAAAEDAVAKATPRQDPICIARDVAYDAVMMIT